MWSELEKTLLKKDDIVQVLAGKEKGKKGKVLSIDKIRGRVTVEKLNMFKKHLKPTRDNQQGGIVEREGSLHLSNVLLVCDKCGKGVRIKKKRLEDGKRVRVCRTCQEVMDKT